MTVQAFDAGDDALDSGRGWLLVGLGLCMLTTIWGTIFTFTVYASHLATTFGLSALQVSFVFSITTAFFLVAGSVFGVFAAAFPLRPVVAVSGAGLAVATALLQVVHSYAGVVAAFALLGTAGGTTFIIVVSLVPRWFDAYRGRAMGITMIGNGVGVLVLPLAWLWLFARTDVRTAFAVVVGAAAAVVLASSLVYRRPRGRSERATTVDATWVRAMIGDRRYLGASMGYSLIWCWYYVLSSHLVDVLTANSISTTVAVASFGTIGGVSIFTRVGSGFVGDWIGRRETLTTGVLLAGAFVFALPLIHSRIPLYVALVGFGVSLGAVAPLWSPIVITRFGGENETATVGLLKIPQAGAAFLAPIAVSVLSNVTGGYVVSLSALSAVTVLGAALFYWGTAPEGE